jgi:hypothetical protein
MSKKELDINDGFHIFIEEMERTEVFEEVKKETLEKYKGKVANKLLEYWEIEGFRAYANGMIWITNPEEYTEIINEYLKDTPFEKIDTFHVFAKDAFATLYLVAEVIGETITINIAFNSIITLESKFKQISENKDSVIESFFIGTDKEDTDMEDTYEEPLFDRALEKLGMLKKDEVYAFKGLLNTGADQTIENLIKMNIFDYIKETRKLGVPSVPFAGVKIDYENNTVYRN